MRAPFTHAIYSEWQTVVLVGTVPVLLDGAGAAAWMACPIPHTLAEIHADVVAALVQLGWNEASARQAVTAVEADYAEAGENPDMAALLRASLRWLGGGHRG